ncbi:MAG: nucleotidyltransferase family protein [Paracoccaceae bacterium]
MFRSAGSAEPGAAAAPPVHLPSVEGPPAHWPPALRALAAGLVGAPAELAPADSDAFAVAAVRTHRVAGFLAGAGRLPDGLSRQAADRIADAARCEAFAALRQKAETLRLVRRLAAARPVVLKGWPLAERLHGSAARRQAKDIDLLIASEALPDAVARLMADGYRPLPEHALRARLLGSAALIEECNDLALRQPDTGHEVELHWRSHHFRGWPDLADLPGAVEPHGAADDAVRVPSDGAHLVYLALHGEAHLWLRLKWLHDVRVLSLRRSTHLGEDLALAGRIGAGPALMRAIRLAGLIFGGACPEGGPAPNGRDARFAARCLALIGRGVEPGSAPARRSFYQAALGRAEGPGQALGVLRYLLWRRMRLGAAALGAARGPAVRTAEGTP